MKHEGECLAFESQRSMSNMAGQSMVVSATLRNSEDRFAPPSESDFVTKDQIEVKDEPLVSDHAESCDFISVEDKNPVSIPEQNERT